MPPRTVAKSPGLLTAALALWLFGHSASASEYCDYGSRTVLLLVDRTMAYDANDKTLMNEGVGKIVPRLKVGDRVVVQSITSDYVYGERKFDRCVPGCPEGTNLIDRYFGQCNTVQANADYRRFRSGLTKVFRAFLSEQAEYRRSDILRSMAGIASAIEQMQQQETRRADQERRSLGQVYAFTDLLENSEEFPWPTIVTKQPDDLVDHMGSMGLLPNLQGASVTVFGYGRLHDKERSALNSTTDRRLRRFWSAYFDAGVVGSYRIGNRLE